MGIADAMVVLCSAVDQAARSHCRRGVASDISCAASASVSWRTLVGLLGAYNAGCGRCTWAHGVELLYGSMAGEEGAPRVGLPGSLSFPAHERAGSRQGFSGDAAGVQTWRGDDE